MIRLKAYVPLRLMCASWCLPFAACGGSGADTTDGLDSGTTTDSGAGLARDLGGIGVTDGTNARETGGAAGPLGSFPLFYGTAAGTYRVVEPGRSVQANPVQNPEGLWTSPDRTTLLVKTAAPGKYEIWSVHGTKVGTLVATTMLGWASNNAVVYLVQEATTKYLARASSDGTGEVKLIVPPSGAQEVTFVTGNQPVSPDGTKVVFYWDVILNDGKHQKETVSVSTADGTVVGRYPNIYASPAVPRFTRDSRIAWTNKVDPATWIRVADPAFATSPIAVNVFGDVEEIHDWTAPNVLLLWVQRDFLRYFYTVRTGEPQVKALVPPVASHLSKARGLAVSPDGSKVAYVTIEGLVVENFDGTSSVTVVAGEIGKIAW